METYILRDKAVKAVQHQRSPNRSPAQNYMLSLIHQELRDIPAADVAPVRHAFWDKIGADRRGRGGILRCAGADGCGKTYPYTCDYCPNCGARMDGDPNGLR